MKIADEVVTVIAGLAATEVKGVASLAGGITNDTVARRGIKALLKGVRVSVTDGLVAVDVTVCLEYGYSIPEVGTAVQEKVKSAIENMTGSSRRMTESFWFTGSKKNFVRGFVLILNRV